MAEDPDFWFDSYYWLNIMFCWLIVVLWRLILVYGAGGRGLSPELSRNIFAFAQSTNDGTSSHRASIDLQLRMTIMK